MDIKKEHDLLAALRFLDNLYLEIQACQALDELRDPALLKKFQEVIKILKEAHGE